MASYEEQKRLAQEAEASLFEFEKSAPAGALSLPVDTSAPMSEDVYAGQHGTVADIGTALIRGTGQAYDLTRDAASMLGAKLPEIELDKNSSLYKWTRPDYDTVLGRDSWLKENSIRAAESLPSMLEAGAIGTVVGGPIGGVAGAAVSVASGTLGLYTLGIARQEYEAIKKERPEISEEEAWKYGWTQGGIQGGLEAVFAVPEVLIGGGLMKAISPLKVVKNMLKGGAKEVAETSIRGAAFGGGTGKQILGRTLNLMGIETGQEMGQEALSDITRKEYGLQSVGAMTASLDAFGPAIITSFLFAGASAGYTIREQKKLVSALNQLERPDLRDTAAKIVGKRIGEQDPELAKTWATISKEKIKAGLQFDLDESLISAGRTDTTNDITPSDIINNPETTSSYVNQMVAETSDIPAFIRNGRASSMGAQSILEQKLASQTPAAQAPMGEKPRLSKREPLYSQETTEGLPQRPSATPRTKTTPTTETIFQAPGGITDLEVDEQTKKALARNQEANRKEQVSLQQELIDVQENELDEVTKFERLSTIYTKLANLRKQSPLIAESISNLSPVEEAPISPSKATSAVKGTDVAPTTQTTVTEESKGLPATTEVIEEAKSVLQGTSPALEVATSEEEVKLKDEARTKVAEDTKVNNPLLSYTILGNIQGILDTVTEHGDYTLQQKQLEKARYEAKELDSSSDEIDTTIDLALDMLSTARRKSSGKDVVKGFILSKDNGLNSLENVQTGEKYVAIPSVKDRQKVWSIVKLDDKGKLNPNATPIVEGKGLENTRKMFFDTIGVSGIRVNTKDRISYGSQAAAKKKAKAEVEAHEKEVGKIKLKEKTKETAEPASDVTVLTPSGDVKEIIPVTKPEEVQPAVVSATASPKEQMATLRRLKGDRAIALEKQRIQAIELDRLELERNQAKLKAEMEREDIGAPGRARALPTGQVVEQASLKELEENVQTVKDTEFESASNAVVDRPSNLEAAEKQMISLMGSKKWKELKKSGKVILSDTGSPGKQGSYNKTTGTITLYVNNIQQGNVFRVLAHERFHEGRDKVFSSEVYKAILNNFSSLREKNMAIAEAFEKAERNNPGKSEEYIAEEAVAYYLEDKTTWNTSIGQKILSWIKQQMVRLFGVRAASQLTPDDLVSIYRREIEKIERDNLTRMTSTTDELLSVGGKGANLTPEQDVSLKKAMLLDMRGELSQQGIADKTGWYKGKDNQWRFRISDKDMEIMEGSAYEGLLNEDSVPFMSLVSHPLLEKYYGNKVLGGLKVEVDPALKGRSAWYHRHTIAISKDVIDGSMPDKELNKILLHEVQHALQEYEGFARGTNLKNTKADIIKHYDGLYYRSARKLWDINRDWKLKNINSTFTSKVDELFNSIGSRFLESNGTVDLLVKIADKEEISPLVSDLLLNIRESNAYLEDEERFKEMAYDDYFAHYGEIESRGQEDIYEMGVEDAPVNLEESLWREETGETREPIIRMDEGRSANESVRLTKGEKDYFTSVFNNEDELLELRDIVPSAAFDGNNLTVSRGDVNKLADYIDDSLRLREDERLPPSFYSNAFVKKFMVQDEMFSETTATGRAAVDHFRTHDKYKEQLDKGESWTASTKGWLSKLSSTILPHIETTSNIIYDISKKIMGKMFRMENAIAEYNLKYSDAAQDYVHKMEQLKKSDMRTYRVLAVCLNNLHIEEDFDTAMSIMKEKGILSSFNKVRLEILADIERRTLEAGMSLEGKSEKYYYPRVVDDYQGLIQSMAKDENYGSIQAEVDAAVKEMKDSGKYYKGYENEVITRILNSGRMYHVKSLRNMQSLKKRRIDRLNIVMNQYYKDPIDALLSHIHSSNEAIETRKFTGTTSIRKNLKDLDAAEKKYDKAIEEGASDEELKPIIVAIQEYEALVNNKEAMIEDSISELLKNEMEGMSPENQIKLREAIRARLAQKGMSGAWADIRNVGMATTLGPSLSAFTQIADLPIMVFRYGMSHGIHGIFGTGEFTGKEFSFNHPLREFNQEGSVKFTDRILKATGLQWMDAIGKISTINAAASKIKSMGEKEFHSTYGHLYSNEQEATDAYKGIKSGKAREELKALSFYELNQLQPVTLMETPPGFLLAGNARMLWMLKIYNIKQVNRIYREVRDEFEAGNKLGAAKKLFYITAILAASGASVDELKDFMMGKDSPFKDKVYNNILRIAFLNRYSLDASVRSGIGKEFLKSVSIPTSGIDEPFKDMAALATGGEFKFNTIKVLPFGRWVYSWTADGREASMKNSRKEVLEAVKANSEGNYSSRDMWDMVNDYNKHVPRDKQITARSIKTYRTKVKNKEEEV